MPQRRNKFCIWTLTGQRFLFKLDWYYYSNGNSSAQTYKKFWYNIASTALGRISIFFLGCLLLLLLSVSSFMVYCPIHPSCKCITSYRHETVFHRSTACFMLLLIQRVRSKSDSNYNFLGEECINIDMTKSRQLKVFW